MSNRWWRSPRAKWTLLALCLLAVPAVAYWFFYLFTFVSTDDARVAATTIRVANLGASGQVIKLSVEEGAQVKKGDVMVELDHRDAEARMEKAKARAEATGREKRRMQELLNQRGIPPSQFDKAREESAMAEADFQLAQVALEKTFLRSPTDGVVVQKLTEVGNLLESGQVAVTVVDIGNAWIAANVEETKVGAVKVGQPVSISIDEGGELSGKVQEIRTATAAQFALIPAENPSGNFIKLVQRIPIKVALDGKPAHPLRVGQSVEVKIRVR
jgi:membrane fusion protein (multidrug efflux system)